MPSKNLLLIMVFSVSLVLPSCAPQKPDESVIQTAIAETEEAHAALATSTSEPTAIPTKAPTKKPTKKPTATEKPRPTATPEEEIDAEPEGLVNKRFVLPHPEYTGYIDSDLADETWADMMNSLARNQAIPQPFEWQLAEMPEPTRWADVYDYYKKTLLADKWSITSDGGSWVTLAQGNTMYVGGFIKNDEGKKEKISILFYPVSKDYKCHYFVFYSLRK